MKVNSAFGMRLRARLCSATRQLMGLQPIPKRILVDAMVQGMRRAIRLSDIDAFLMCWYLHCHE